MSSPAKFNIFVGTKIAEIQEVTTTINGKWHFAPTLLNSADILSRGATLSEVERMSTWWLGPEYLTQNIANWPDQSKFLNKLAKKQFADEMKSIVSASAVL